MELCLDSIIFHQFESFLPQTGCCKMQIALLYWILLFQFWIMSFIYCIHCPSCEKIHCHVRKVTKLRCKGGITTGICGCCSTCAKTIGERCGGDFAYLGKCDSGLYCQMTTPKYVGREPDGVCQKVPVQIHDAPAAKKRKCRPACSAAFCKKFPKAICSAVDVAEVTRICHSPCQHTSCRACHFNLELSCRKCPADDFRCLKKFGKCVKRQYCTKQKFPCRTKPLKREEKGKFQCYVPDCQ